MSAPTIADNARISNASRSARDGTEEPGTKRVTANGSPRTFSSVQSNTGYGTGTSVSTSARVTQWFHGSGPTSATDIAGSTPIWPYG